MQQLDALTLFHLAYELNSQLVGAKINKVQHPAEHEFLLGVWGGAAPRNQRLYVNLNPQHPCCFWLKTDNVDGVVIHRLAKPTGFCMQLRKHLMNAKVVVVKTPMGERVLNIHFENTNELGNRVKLLLSLELMGMRSNMLLVDEVQGIILGAAKTVSPTMSQFREVGGGLPYQPPPPPPGLCLPLASSAQLDALVYAVSSSSDEVDWPAVWGVSKPVLRAMLQHSRDAADMAEQLHRWFIAGSAPLAPCLSLDKTQFALTPDWLPAGLEWFPVSCVTDLVQQYFQYHIGLRQCENLRRQLGNVLRQHRQKLKNTLAVQRPEANDAAEQLIHQGNLLLTAISARSLSGNPTQNMVSVEDYVTGEAVTLPVNPLLSWADNAARWFNQAKKQRVRQVRFADLQAEVDSQWVYLDELDCLIQQADSLNDWMALKADFSAAGLIKDKPVMGEKGDKPAVYTGILTCHASDGTTLLVGKSGQGNAAILGKHARGYDLWLHVHEMPGSHVLVQTQRQEVSDQTLLEAATLAVYFSAARTSKNVPVVYTQARFVRKIPNSWPGHVTYKNEQSVFITVDEGLMGQLLI